MLPGDMSQQKGKDNLAIYAYGSLLSEPGEPLGGHIVARVSHPSPWPIEYARRAKLRGDGPTLVIHDAGGIVQGQLLVLDVAIDRLADIRVWLWEREGKPPRERIREMAWNGFSLVLYCDLESTLRGAELDPESLARFALDSVKKNPQRNAINYLARNIEQGIITPLTYPYRDAILRFTGAKDLRQAEKLELGQ
jgi:hypothetical protein